MATPTRRGDGGGRRMVVPTSSLTRKPVRNPAGEDLGKIEDIVIDQPTGSVSYAVLSFGGFLGLGDKLFAIPWDELRLADGEDTFILDVSQEVLEEAPGFDENDWPDFGDPQFSERVDSHYGTRRGRRDDRGGQTGAPPI